MSNPDDLESFQREVYTNAASNVFASKTLHQNDYMGSQLIEEEQLFAQRLFGKNLRSGLLMSAVLVTLFATGVFIWYLAFQGHNQPVQPITSPENEAPRTP